MDWLSEITWNTEGLLPVIVQDYVSKTILMFAWMNREALEKTYATKQAVYWSRSRQKLWYKGEQSGHMQTVHELRLDCDGDVLLMSVVQKGGIACHTGRADCFFRKLDDGRWVVDKPVLKSPDEIY